MHFVGNIQHGSEFLLSGFLIEMSVHAASSHEDSIVPMAPFLLRSRQGRAAE